MNVLFSLILLLAPIKAENGRFTIYQDGKKIGTEEFAIGRKPNGYVAQGRTQISVNNQTFDLHSRMELDEQLNPTLYEFESKGNLIRLKIEKPISELEYTVAGKRQAIEVDFPTGGVIIDDNFFHHYLLLLYRAGAITATIPTFVPQQMTIGTLTIRPAGNRTFEIESGNVKLVATTDVDGRMIKLTVPDAKVVVER